MYTRPVLYKIYSIYTIAVAALSFLSSIAILFVAVPTKGIDIPYVDVIIKSCAITTSVISLFFAYVNFSSMFTFAQMIQYENSPQPGPFKKPPFVLPAKFYSKFGFAITMITFLISLVSVIVLIITESVVHQTFFAVPVLKIIPFILFIVLVYITYYVRYKAFGDLLDLLSKSEPDPLTLNNIKENKPGVLRGYCVFLFGFAFAVLAALIVLGFIFAGTISAIVGILGTVFLYIYGFICYVIFFIELAITGCYFDNLAKMLEHYMIKYKLLSHKI